MSEGGSDTRSGIGARLRAGREKMGFTQLQAAEKLHVDAKIIESLEAERFDALGAPVFVRGHLKRYCDLIGESAAELLEIYSAATKAVLPDLTKLPKAAPEASPSRLAVPALVVLIGFVLLGVVWWVVKSVGNSEAGAPKRGPQPVVIAPDVPEEPVASADPPSANPADANGASQPSAAAKGGAGATESARTRGESGPARTPGAGVATTAGVAGASANIPAQGGARGTSTVAAAGPGTTSAPTTAPIGAASTAAAPGGTAATGPARGKAMEVTLRFTADSWVEVYDAKGEKLFYDVGAADSSHTVSGTPPFRVTVANAPGVSLDVNGKPATVPANAVKGPEAQFTINRSGRIVRALPAAGGG